MKLGKRKPEALICSQKLRQAKQKERIPKWTVLIKAGLYYNLLRIMSKKRIFCNVLKLTICCILRVEDSNSNHLQVEKKTVKTKEIEENLSQVMSW